MKLLRCLIGIGALGLMALAPHAFAQTSINDVEGAITQGSQFDEARELIDQRRQDAEDEAIIDGEAGVFILKKTEIFTVGLSTGGGYSSNPTRTLDTSEESAFANLAVRAGINTIIGDTYDVGVNVVGSGTEYEEDSGPSNRTLVANAFVGRSVWDNRIYLSGSLVSGVNADDSFDQGRAFYGATVNASYIHQLSDNVLVRPSVNLSRQLSGESEQDNFSAGASAEIIWQPAAKWSVIGQVAYTYREYDNFFEDVTFVKRQDDQVRVGITVSRRITDKVSLSASYDYTTQDSSFFLSGYDSHDGGASLQVSRRF